jgi:hypothetical protein
MYSVPVWSRRASKSAFSPGRVKGRRHTASLVTYLLLCTCSVSMCRGCMRCSQTSSILPNMLGAYLCCQSAAAAAPQWLEYFHVYVHELHRSYWCVCVGPAPALCWIISITHQVVCFISYCMFKPVHQAIKGMYCHHQCVI